mgnify:CR=1 FL=1
MLVSIIIPYFKDEKNIFLSVSSALKQTYKNIEIIIIDNENSINSKKILKKISKQSKKIEVIINEKLGNYAGIGRNLGVSFSKGELIAFLDSDDLWSKDKLKLQVKELKDKIGADKVILGLSGGVDSSVAAILLHKAIGSQLNCIFVDNGLLRKNEFDEVLKSYESLGLNVKGVDAKNKFYAALKGLKDPEEKRRRSLQTPG